MRVRMPESVGAFIRRNKALCFLIVLAVIACIALLDYATGNDADLTFLYLIPVSFAAWYLGIWPAVVSAVASSAGLFITNRLVGGVFRSVIREWQYS